MRMISFVIFGLIGCASFAGTIHRAAPLNESLPRTSSSSPQTGMIALAAIGTNGYGSSIANPTATSGVVFYTAFPATESPMSQGGIWTQGCTTGLDWGCIQTFGGVASESGVQATYPTNLNNSTAVLIGTWTSNQQAAGTIYVGSLGKLHDFEVELRLRTTITTHSITGYEFTCSVSAATGAQYLGIARWDGALNNFTSIGSGTTGVGCANGDVIKVTAIGSTLTMYKNGTQVWQARDSTYRGALLALEPIRR